MKEEVRSQESEVRMPGLGNKDWGFGLQGAKLRARQLSGLWPLLAILLTSNFCLLTSAFGATHVTAAYDLGANPQVMATVGGEPQYGLVFAQRNKAVTYMSVEYGPSVVKGYLDANGELNDGAGNLWLDLIPNLGATPAGSYYVVTFNIQGQVHAEIWVVPDIATVDAETIRQTQPPGATGGGFDLNNATGLLGLAHGGTGQSNWIASRCVRVNDSGNALEPAPADCGTGGSAPKASATVSGTVKTDATETDPVVYLKTTSDTLLAGKASSVHTHSESDVTNLVTDLAGKVPTTRNVGTSAPLAGGGTLDSDLTLSCPTCEVTGNKNAASGYAGLTVSTKLNAAQGQEVWALGDLTDVAGTSGSGSTAILSTITSPADAQCLVWNDASSNWVNGSCAGGSSNHNLLSATHPDTVPAAPVLGDILYGNSTPAWTKLTGNTTTTKNFLTQTGNGSASAAPAWGTIADGDLPATIARDSELHSQVHALIGPDHTASGLTAGQPLRATGATTFDFGALDLGNSNAVTGVLGSAQGGTGNAFFAVSGPASAIKTFTFPNANATIEYQANKNAASGYAGLDGAAKLTASQGQEVWGAADLTDYTGTSGSGSTAIKSTITTPSDGHVLTYSSGNWVNQAPSGGTSHEVLSSTHTDTTAASVQRGDLMTGQGATPKWTRLAKGGASECLQMDGSGTDITWGSCGAGGGDSVSVNGTAASDADFDDATPAAPGDGVNVRWQKDASSPNNISANVPFAGAAQAGAVSTGAQNFAGTKTFSNNNFILGSSSSNSANSGLSINKTLTGSTFAFGFTVEGTYTGTNNNAYGMWMNPTLAPPDTKEANFFYAAGDVATGAANTIAAAYAGKLQEMTKSGTGSVTTAYGLWVNSQTIGATDYTIYANGSGTSFFGGPVQHANDITFTSDNSNDIGASGASRPRTGYFATSVVAPTLNATTGFQVNGAATSGNVLRGNGTNFVSSPDTREIFFRIGSGTGAALTDADDEATVFRNSIGAMTITEVWCESDAGSPVINLARDDGSPANILSSNLTCSTSGATGTIDTNEDNIAAGDKIDFTMVTAGGTAARVTVAIKMTVD